MMSAKDGNGADRAGAAAEAAGPAGPAPDLTAGKSVAQVFGEIVWLMTQDAELKQRTLADLEWLVMPPVLLKQFRMFYQGEQPIGVVLWAKVSDAVAAGLDAGVPRLTPADWTSGDHRRVIRVIAPFGGAEELRSLI